MQTTYITVIIGILVPTVVLMAIVIRVCIMRRSRSSAGGPNGYSQVQHNLDEEEIEFKRMFETQSDNIDDICGDRSASDSDFAFDTKDLDRLHMLDKYRDTLVASSAREENSLADEQQTPLRTTRTPPENGDNDEIRV